MKKRNPNGLRFYLLVAEADIYYLTPFVHLSFSVMVGRGSSVASITNYICLSLLSILK